MENPWISLKRINNEYIANCDKETITYFKSKLHNEFELKLNLTPGPYYGDPDKAKVFLLGLNPGYSDEDANICEKNEKIIIDSLTHSIKQHPFLPLNPINYGSPGFNWWRKRLRVLIDKTSLDVVQNFIFGAEFFPYPSIKFKRVNRILPSQQYTFYLIKKAIQDKKCIIIKRSKRIWYDSVPELEKYERKYILKNPQCTYISPGNMDNYEFNEVVKVLKL